MYIYTHEVVDIIKGVSSFIQCNKLYVSGNKSMMLRFIAINLSDVYVKYNVSVWNYWILYYSNRRTQTTDYENKHLFDLI